MRGATLDSELRRARRCIARLRRSLPRRITADSRSVARGRRVRRVSGPARRRPHVHPRRRRARRRRVLWERARLSLDAAWQRRQRRASTACKAKLGAIADLVYGIRRARCGSSASPAPTARRRARTGSRRPRAPAAARGVVGTLGNGLVGALAPGGEHDARRGVLHEMLAAFRGAGARAVAMEVSSHGLDQGRVNARRVRRRAVHQPHARPPRLSRHDGGVRRGEGEAVRLARARRRVVNVDDPFGAEPGRRRARRAGSAC